MSSLSSAQSQSWSTIPPRWELRTVCGRVSWLVIISSWKSWLVLLYVDSPLSSSVYASPASLISSQLSNRLPSSTIPRTPPQFGGRGRRQVLEIAGAGAGSGSGAMLTPFLARLNPRPDVRTRNLPPHRHQSFPSHPRTNIRLLRRSTPWPFFTPKREEEVGDAR